LGGLNYPIRLDFQKKLFYWLYGIGTLWKEKQKVL
jgi:hypothetical protein